MAVTGTGKQGARATALPGFGGVTGIVEQGARAGKALPHFGRAAVAIVKPGGRAATVMSGHRAS